MDLDLRPFGFGFGFGYSDGGEKAGPETPCNWQRCFYHPTITTTGCFIQLLPNGPWWFASAEAMSITNFGCDCPRPSNSVTNTRTRRFIMASDLKTTVLVGKLSITNWEAKKKAKGIERTAEEAAGAAHGTISARKSLLPGAEALDTIIKHGAAMRTWWNQVSAPWFDNGMRVYNVAGHFDIQTAYGDMARYRDGLVTTFMQEYPELREKARFDLNDLFDDSEYPTPEVVRHKFTCSFEVMPLPDIADFRIVQGISPEEAARLQAEADLKAQARVQEATATTVRRLMETIRTVADRLGEYTRKEDSDEKRAFYESWVLNVQEMADLLPQLNLTGDPELNAIAAHIKEAFDQPALFYKDNYEARRVATTKARDIAARLSSLFTVTE